jgi:hypothetical protein
LGLVISDKGHIHWLASLINSSMQTTWDRNSRMSSLLPEVSSQESLAGLSCCAAGLLMLCENPGKHVAVNVTARGDDSDLLARDL